MKTKYLKKEENKNKFEIVKYNSINEFYNYICNTPFNDAFRWAQHLSVEEGKDFTGTNNFDEAVNLMKTGWEDMSKRLTKRLNVVCKDVSVITRKKSVYDVVGYQANVPRYLQGIPTNMVRNVNVPIKQKTVTVVKSIDYSANVKTDAIIEESIKALAVVKKIEAQGIRVNLDICIGTVSRNDKFVLRIRVKNANERLNVSKLAFVMVHPSMLRRLIFRWIEVYPNISRNFVGNYGCPSKTEQLLEILDDNEYLLPAFIKNDINQITGFDDLLK